MANSLFAKCVLVCTCVALALCVIGCSNYNNETNEYSCNDTEQTRFVDTNDFLYENAVLDNETGVVYLVCSNTVGLGITPLYNADGTLYNVEDLQ